MAETRIHNAKIKHAMLGIEDHGILTWMLRLEYGSYSCGFGGRGLDNSGDFMSGSVRKVLETVGVDDWCSLNGKLIRIKAAPGLGPITEIGHILDDRWFNLDQFAAEWKESNA